MQNLKFYFADWDFLNLALGNGFNAQQAIKMFVNSE
jgi:hypothetical protein